MDEFAAVWPSSRRQAIGKSVGAFAGAAPLDGLAGRRVAFVWDYRFKGAEMFALLREEIQVSVPGVEFVEFEEIGDIHGGDGDERIATLGTTLRDRGVDAAILGVGG
jgi:hypothetical protein